MLRATIWRDLRWRLLAAVPLALVFPALVAITYAIPGGATAGAPASGYAAYLDAAWFRLPGPTAIFLVVAVLVGAGGTLRRPRRDVAFLLTLPVSRERWVLAHVAMPLAALGGLILLVVVVLAAGAWRAGAPVAVLPLLGRSLALFVAAGAWVGVTVAAVALVRHPLVAGTLVVVTVALLPSTRFRFELPVRAPAPTLPAWDPWALADPRAWQGTIPLASLATAIALGVGGVAVAVWVMRRVEG